MLEDGRIQCWGSNAIGQLGDGTIANDFMPVFVQGVSTARQVLAGREHSCALLNDKRVQCWGNNTVGELGDGSLEPSLVPVFVDGISTATQISGYDATT